MPVSRLDASERLIDEVGAFLRRTRASSILVAQSCGLQVTHVQLLFALRRLGESRVATLAETQLVDPSVASRQVAGLEKLGLVERRSDPEDARAALVSLTEKGHAKLGEVRRRHREVVTAALADWPVERVTRLTDDLSAFVVASGPVYDELAGERAGILEVV
ncbi:MarR family winged helix-turn-helix transcriptional regulator [Georgenia alba]|uniref:MarR family winged helix-turn-helix transcriptional regulator n=1 Tax=Georgenia alba TaxID=2233858 RepID=A0ABW2Q596_9MICO